MHPLFSTDRSQRAELAAVLDTLELCLQDAVSKLSERGPWQTMVALNDVMLAAPRESIQQLLIKYRRRQGRSAQDLLLKLDAFDSLIAIIKTGYDLNHLPGPKLETEDITSDDISERARLEVADKMQSLLRKTRSLKAALK